ncbi:hypothetical protein RFI_25596 [Reticulomyxa filosa]|uniref:Uncharacterized protein n=1 Tax=Reticulomyxa filosa TaxID=46433 RepID=X6MFF9_RETFI|nr:hypothetical protein RFI_25596 [Reticulomyxa filosa]|eukprot:ETO11780.1 hypothetical protein RFI_25596 [Reticulomyxa filosa]
MLSRKVLSHTFSGNFRTLFVHFEVDVNEKQLTHLAQNFNDAKDGQIEQKENQGSQDVTCFEEYQLAKVTGRLWISNTRVKRFHKMPIVKVLLSKTEDVVKISKDNDIQIVYSMVKVEPFDKSKSRPKSHFSNAGNAAD